MPQENLFSSFKEYSLDDWKSFIINDLKGRKYESLISQTPEGISIDPVYHGYPKEIKNFFNPAQLRNEALPARNWVNNCTIAVTQEKEANLAALEALNNGADGLIFEISGPVDLELLLNDIQLIYCTISFKTKEANFKLISEYVDYLNSKQYDLELIAGNYFFDALEMRDAGVYQLENSIIDDIVRCIELTKPIPHFKCLYISGLLYHNSGANNLNEVSLLLSKSAEYFDKLTEAGLAIEAIANSLVFGIAFGSNFFLEIAKAKVLRINIQKLFQAYSLTNDISNLKLVGFTSDRTKSALDFNVNLLRNTTEAMSAILSGCNELFVAPHDNALVAESRSTFKRIALNISNLLKEEVHLDKVVDPTMGSYYLEALIANLEEKSWDTFLMLEQKGSYSSLFNEEYVKEIIKHDDQQSANAVMSRKNVFIGANMFQNIGEKLYLHQTSEKDDLFLHPRRVGWKLENIRARTEHFVNKHGENARPTATMVIFGTDPVSKAKADFAYSFLGMAGIKIAKEIILNDLHEMRSTLKGVDSTLLIYCFNETPDFQQKHFKHGDAKIIIAGQAVKEEDWKQQGLYAFINRKVDTYSFLQNLLNDIKIEA